MNKTLKTVLIVVISVMLLLFILIGVFFLFLTKTLTNAGNSDYYAIGDDKIISITNVVGKRKLNNISTNKEKGVTIKKYGYINIDDVKSDINKYIDELKNNNYINTTDIDLSKNNNSISLANYSVDDGYIIIVNIEYDLGNYTITLKKGKGTIQPYN